MNPCQLHSSTHSCLHSDLIMRRARVRASLEQFSPICILFFLLQLKEDVYLETLSRQCVDSGSEGGAWCCVLGRAKALGQFVQMMLTCIFLFIPFYEAEASLHMAA